ncbi:hypothetical protein ABIE61_001659, partial [Marinobacterium sp. MBR-111]|uniref:beta strand repeat-containing protein n=1 Tax=Marinobacterium sp. MBR-111 TaxID=3156463 RepID=UPI00339AE5DA
MELTANQKLVHQMYIAYYQRPADPQGLKYWVDQLETYQDWTVISAAFGSPENAENQALYGSKSREEVIAEIYQSAFDRAAVAEEISYWADSEHSLTNLAFAIINGAQNDDLAAVNAKVAFSQELIEQVDPAGNGLPAEYEIPFTSLDVVNMLKDVNKDTDVTPEYVEEAVAAQLNPNSVFTLTENIVTTVTPAVEGETLTKMVTYWGDDAEGNGVPLEDAIAHIQDLAGLNFVQLGLINIANGTDDGVNDGSVGDNPASSTQIYADITGLDIVNNADGTQTITVTLSDGTVNTAEVALGEMYFDLLHNALYDADGNSRLFEVEVPVASYWVVEPDDGVENLQTIQIDTDGDGAADTWVYADTDGDPIKIPYIYGAKDAVENESIVPIVLTPTENNGGTEEIGKTSAADDFIVAGRLELLHGAYIDGGEGNNTLEIDAKGYYAQPKALLNIQTINIENLPNVYTDVSGDSTYPGIADPADPPDTNEYQNSIIDLSRAVDIENLTITESNFEDMASGGATVGSLTVAGIRNGATTTLDGGFTQDVTLHFSEATAAEGINLVFNNLSMEDGQLNVAHNAETLNIDSAGAGNFIANGNLGGTLSTLNITGDAHLYIEDDLNASFHDETPVFIDASENTGGVNLTLTESDDVTFHGSQANDIFDVSAADKVVIEGNGGNNEYIVNTDVAIINVLDGDNTITANNAENVSITTGNGNNTITTDDSDTVSITTGEGNDVISSVRGETVSINAAGGDNQVTVSAEEMSITTGAGNDTVIVSGMGVGDYGDANSGFGESSPTALLNIETGAGEDTVVLGRDVFGTGLFGITALEGSSISGENITLYVENASDLRAAELSGIENVVLTFDISERGSPTNYEVAPVLTLTDAQFLAIGADAFSVEGSIFNTYAQIKIIVTESTSLTDLGVDSLSRNIDLQLELQDGVTLEMTAEQLHTRVAPEGVTLTESGKGNTDLAAGNVVITGAAGVFDPFNTSDTMKTNIDGNVYYGGSLSGDFKVGDNWFNVSFTGETGYDEDGNEIVGYDRPADVPAEVVYKINTGTGSNSVTDDGLSTWHTNLEITGARDITFTGPIQLGEVQGDSANFFTIDFSELEGVVSGMTIDHFEQLAQGGAIYGNGNNGYATEVLVHLAADADDNVGFDEAEANSLVSKGVARYVVTQIDGPTAAGSAGSTATIKLCDTTEDLEVMALRGNYNDTLVIQDAAWGLVFELQGGTTAKADGPTGTANVGKLDADFEWEGAAAVVNLVHSVAGDDRPLKAYGIDIDNADTLTITAEGPAAEIASVVGADLVSLTLAAEGDLTIDTALADGINTIDASAVAGDLTVATAVTSTAAEDFSFTGSEGVTELTMTAAFVASEDSVLTSAGELNLVVDNGTDEASAGAGITVDLTRADVTDVDTVVVGAGDTLNLTVAQAYEIGPENITGADATARLQLSDLGEEPFNLNDFGIDNIVVDTIAIIDQPVVTLHPDTDLTGVTTLLVNEGTTLNLTAAQFQQLTNNGVISGVGTTTDFTVNITDLEQADVAENALVLTGIAADNVSLTLAESVVLPTGSNLNVNDGIADGNGNLTINIGDNLSLSVLTLSEMDGVTVVGGTESTLEFLATTGGDFPTNIDASGFDVDYLRLTDLLVSGNNVDYMFENLLERVTKVIYNGVGDVAGRLQNVVVEEGTTIFGDISFNEYQLDSEITHLTLNLEGGTRIHDGDL